MFNPRFVVASSALTFLAVFAGGCGSSSTKAATKGTTTTTAAPQSASVITASTTTVPKDPCTRVTKAEIASATGKSVTEAKKGNDFLCNYITSDGGVVNISVAGPLRRANIEGQLKAETTAGTLPPTMAGLGDVAYLTLGGLEVLKGTQAIRISVFGTGSYAAPGNAGAVALARLLLGRI
jgi:hypothetical protein